MASQKDQFTAYIRISCIVGLLILAYISTKFTDIYLKILFILLSFCFIFVLVYTPRIYERILKIEYESYDLTDFLT